MENRELHTQFSGQEMFNEDCNSDKLTHDKDETGRANILHETKKPVYSKQLTQQSEDSLIPKSDDACHVKISSHFLSIPYGLILKATYEHGNKHTEIMGVTYNERMRQFVILDSTGITNWKRDAVEPRVHRALSYKKYEYRMIKNVLYAKKYNCYFVLGKDFSLKVFNKDFIETCSVSSDLRSVLFMLFNPVRDELITGGLGGTKVWHFQQRKVDAFGDLRMHSSFGLSLKYELPNVGGSWVRHVELDHQLEHLYCCSDHDLYVYDLEGKLLFKFLRAHSMSITGCRYSRHANVLVTSSLDCEVKIWSLIGGLVHTFRGHSRAVTNMILHPSTSSIVVTCSLDGTVRMWSLDTMDCLYCLVVSVDGIQWMGLTDDNFLYLSTPRTLTLWHMNYSVQFWALVRSQVTRIVRCGCKGKTTRLMTISEDSSVRLMARSNHKNLTTVLPPPNISPLQQVMSVCYSREFNTIYMLINSQEIWVYTVRTDPACRIAVWNMTDIQKSFSAVHYGITESEKYRLVATVGNLPHIHKTAEVTESGLARCCCTAVLSAAIIIWTKEGYCCPVRDSFILVGLEDGRILFMDPIIKGQKYLELKTGKDPVLDMCYDVAHSGLVTLHKLKNMMKILVWCVPELTLQHEVYAPNDLKDFARESNILVTGHGNGCVIFHTLEPAVDPGLHKAKGVYEDILKLNHKPEHQVPVIAVDVCVTLKIFCSCSDDGAIKIWHDKVLLTEIMLNSGLSAACFLNNRGDLLVGYMKHVFYIDHTKESYICEDPAVLFEGVSPNYDEVTLENYLVPFDLEFSKDFMEGEVTMDSDVAKEKVSNDADDVESQVSVAPTEIYLSPEYTPRRRLSYVDLILSSEVTNYDLLKHIKKTVDHLAEKEKQDAAQLAYQERVNTENRAFLHHQWTMRGKDHLANYVNDSVKGRRKGKRDMKTEAEKRMDIRLSFPQLGDTPGASPVSSTCTTPDILAESEKEHKKVDSVLENIDVNLQTVTVMTVHDDVVRKSQKTEVKLGRKAAIEPFTTKTKFGLSDITVDVKTLMKDTKKPIALTANVPKSKPNPEPFQVKKVLDSGSEATEKKTGHRKMLVKKKMVAASQRKNVKSNISENLEKCQSEDEPSTQIQTLELQNQETYIPKKDSLAGENELCNEKKETESSIRSNKMQESSPSSVTKLERAALEGEDISSAADSNIWSRGVGDSSRTLTANLAVHMDDVSVASTRSTDVMPASRHGVMYQNQSETRVLDDKTSPSLNVSLNQSPSQETEEMELLTTFGTWIESGVKTPALLETVDVSSVYLQSHTFSDSTCQSSTNPLSPNCEHLKEEESFLEFKCLSKCLENFEQPKKQNGGNNPSLMIRDISVSQQQVESHDQDQDKMGGLTDHRKPGPRADLTTEDQAESMLYTSEIVATKSRPQTPVDNKLLDQPELDNVIKYFKQRPHTAQLRFTTEDLQAAFETSLIKYKSLLKTSLKSNKVYQNNDREFSENWHERQIERHTLIRMQKELRAQTALRKRQMVKHTGLEHWKQQVIRDHGVADRRPSSPHFPPNITQRASTVHGNRSSFNVLTLTPKPSRPHTTGRLYDRHSLQLLKQPKPQPSLMMKKQQMQQTQTKPTRHQKYMVGLQEQAGPGYEKSFRCKLRQQKESQEVAAQVNFDFSLPIDPWLLDPRNPNAVRPKSSKSIPDKCHHFVLVTKPTSQDSFPLPTPQEKYLLAMRFPQQAERIFRRIQKLLGNTSLELPDSEVDGRSYQGQLFG